MRLHPATDDLLTEHLANLGGFESPSEARRVAGVVLEAFRERLGDLEAQALARDLPPSYAAPLRAGAYRGEVDVDDLYAAITRHEGVTRGVGAEHAQLVLRAIGDAVSDDTRSLLERELSPRWSALLFAGDREEGQPPPHGAPKVGAPIRMTLSSAHPGFRNPIAGGSADRAQSHSVAKESDPHEDRKMSTARPGRMK